MHGPEQPAVGRKQIPRGITEKPRSRMKRKSETVNLVNFVHLNRNDQHLGFAYVASAAIYKSRVAAAPRRASLDSTRGLLPDCGC